MDSSKYWGGGHVPLCHPCSYVPALIQIQCGPPEGCFRPQTESPSKLQLGLQRFQWTLDSICTQNLFLTAKLRGSSSYFVVVSRQTFMFNFQHLGASGCGLILVLLSPKFRIIIGFIKNQIHIQGWVCNLNIKSVKGL